MQSLTQWLSRLSLADPIVWIAFAAGLGVILLFLLVGRRQPRNPEIIITNQLPKMQLEPIAPPPVAHHDERRKSIRRTGMPTPVMLMDFKSTRRPKPIDGYVLDRSSGGLRLAVEKPIPVGTMLKVRPSNAPPEFDWINIVIRSSRESSDYFELGCQFEGDLALNQLLMFG
jgi:hypothetical protein